MSGDCRDEDTRPIEFNSSGFAQCERACEVCCAGARAFEKEGRTHLMFYRETLSWGESRKLPLSRLVAFSLAGRSMEGVRR